MKVFVHGVPDTNKMGEELISAAGLASTEYSAPPFCQVLSVLRRMDSIPRCQAMPPGCLQNFNASHKNTASLYLASQRLVRLN